MTPEQITKAKKLRGCSFLPGSWDKRFCRDMAYYAEHHPERELTDKQAACLARMAHRYRRQIGATP